MNVKKQVIGEEVRWKVTVKWVSNPNLTYVKDMEYEIIDEKGHIKERGKLLEKNNVTFIDKDNSSTLSEWDLLHIRGTPYSNVRSEDEFRLLFKGHGLAMGEL